MANILKYTHTKLEEAVICSAGYYTPLKEVRLRYKNREILYMVAHAVLESSCCGSSRGTYVSVPGYIINWQSMTNEAGLPVSKVEPISDEATREDVRRIISEAEPVSQIEFW
ncbi:hypothetical protein ACFLU8_04330 [Chloroflexota bacterium]